MHTCLSTSIHAITTAAVILLLSSCGKHDITPNCEAPLCQIQQLEGYDVVLQQTHTNTIEYNAAGNPVLRLRSNVGTGSENESYRYDSHNRLTDQITHYNTKEEYGDLFWEWHRFKYDNQNRIYMDSVYNIGIIGDNPLPHPTGVGLINITYFEYDYKGRVIKETSYFDDGRLWYTKAYVYNNKQNLVEKGTTYGNSGYTDTTHYGPHDNKVNYLRTNKVWQFLNRDYSENNPIAALTYNKYGLPLKFRPDSKNGGRTYFLDVVFSDLDITYKCK
ncbi:hypothetical protein [Chitinophaga filiformis]|uniref:YD repeat-containing protein n=1 Tax=Chitinophaga filiformis TaxID=104663 RepID=A0ABY4I9D2_CHIFI|nr:hypothetical protein [Chitinophaga filiformis]UPK71296.1 hypothetical protein MYF79_08370 [Chitinophaga filiformis]